MGRLLFVVFVCGCATTSSSGNPTPLEVAIERETDAKAFAIPAVAFSAMGLTFGAADVARAPNSPAWMHGITIASLGAGLVTTVIAAVYNHLAEKAREEAKALERAQTQKR